MTPRCKGNEKGDRVSGLLFDIRALERSLYGSALPLARLRSSAEVTPRSLMSYRLALKRYDVDRSPKRRQRALLAYEQIIRM